MPVLIEIATGWGLWIPACEFVNFSPWEVSVAGIDFTDELRGWATELLDGEVQYGSVPFTALARDLGSGIRAASTGERGPT